MGCDNVKSLAVNEICLPIYFNLIVSDKVGVGIIFFHFLPDKNM